MPFKDAKKAKAYAKAWRKRNPEYWRQWHAKNPGYWKGYPRSVKGAPKL